MAIIQVRNDRPWTRLVAVEGGEEYMKVKPTVFVHGLIGYEIREKSNLTP